MKRRIALLIALAMVLATLPVRLASAVDTGNLPSSVGMVQLSTATPPSLVPPIHPAPTSLRATVHSTNIGTAASQGLFDNRVRSRFTIWHQIARGTHVQMGFFLMYDDNWKEPERLFLAPDFWPTIPFELSNVTVTPAIPDLFMEMGAGNISVTMRFIVPDNLSENITVTFNLPGGSISHTVYVYQEPVRLGNIFMAAGVQADGNWTVTQTCANHPHEFHELGHQGNPTRVDTLTARPGDVIHTTHAIDDQFGNMLISIFDGNTFAAGVRNAIEWTVDSPNPQDRWERAPEDVHLWGGTLTLAATNTSRTVRLYASYGDIYNYVTINVLAHPATGDGGGAAEPTPTPTPPAADADGEEDEDDTPPAPPEQPDLPVGTEVVEDLADVDIDDLPPGTTGVAVEAKDGEITADGDVLGDLADAGLNLVVAGEYEIAVLPPAVLYELADIADGEEVIITLDSEVLVALDELEVEGGIIELAAVTFEITAGDEALSELAGYVTITVSLGEDLADAIVDEGLNPNRIIAVLEDGTMIGGTLDLATGEFVFETDVLGSFTIQYVEDLTRVTLQMGSNVAFCSAGNAPTQVMDVPPQVTPDGRTVLPLRAMGYLLGADVHWEDATERITLTLNGQSFSFILGEQDSQLIGGRTMVPVRAIAEFFGATVNWCPITGDVEILAVT